MKIKLSLWKLYQIILSLLSLIKRNFIAANNIIDANTDIIFDSFPNAERIIVRNTKINNKDIYITLPLLTPLNFNLNDITDELYRLETLFDNKILTSNNYIKTKLLIIFNNIQSYGIIRYLLTKNNFSTYHSISNNIDAYNISKVIEKETNYKLNVIDLESNIESSVRLLKDDYDNDFESISTVTLYIMSNNDNLSDLLSVIEYKSNCIISIPNNKFILLLLKHMFFYHKVFTILNQNQKFLLVKVDNLKKKPITTMDIIDEIITIYNKIKDKLFNKKQTNQSPRLD